jgi:hypothetical protein
MVTARTVPTVSPMICAAMNARADTDAIPA